MERLCKDLYIDQTGGNNSRVLQYMGRVKNVIQRHALADQLAVKGMTKTLIDVTGLKLEWYLFYLYH
jgi:hypothetical protein